MYGVTSGIRPSVSGTVGLLQ